MENKKVVKKTADFKIIIFLMIILLITVLVYIPTNTEQITEFLTGNVAITSSILGEDSPYSEGINILLIFTFVLVALFILVLFLKSRRQKKN